MTKVAIREGGNTRPCKLPWWGETVRKDHPGMAPWKKKRKGVRKKLYEKDSIMYYVRAYIWPIKKCRCPYSSLAHIRGDWWLYTGWLYNPGISPLETFRLDYQRLPAHDVLLHLLEERAKCSYWSSCRIQARHWPGVHRRGSSVAMHNRSGICSLQDIFFVCKNMKTIFFCLWKARPLPEASIR